MGARFSVPIQTGPRTYPASVQRVPALSRGKAAGAWRWPPSPSSAEVKERTQLHLYSTSGPSWPVLGRTLPLPLFREFLRSWEHQHDICLRLLFGRNKYCRPFVRWRFANCRKRYLCVVLKWFLRFNRFYVSAAVGEFCDLLTFWRRNYFLNFSTSCI